jgi:tetratricopeptide (TPR) repeat protein
VIELLLQAEGALSVGLLDRAEALYRQVATADPRNAIAIVGLSRVALERGQQREALELARRGLAIDPENAAAQRMVERLEEVLDYRGEPSSAAEAPEAPSSVPSSVPSVGPSGPKPPARSEPEPTPPPASQRRSVLDRLLRRR